MAPLGSPTKTAISPSSTTGLPMIEPSAKPGSGTGFSHVVPSALRADQGGPGTDRHRRRRNRTRRGNALGQAAFEGRRAIRPLEAVLRRPGEGDVAGARPQDHRVLAGGRGLGDATGAQERIERRGLPGAGRVADPDPRDRRMRAIAVALAEGQDAIAPRDRMPDRVRGAGERLARPGRAVVGRRPGDPVFAGRSAGCDGDDRARQRDDVGDRADIGGIGQVDKLPGEVRRGRGGRGRRRRAGRGDGDRGRCDGEGRRGVAAGATRRPRSCRRRPSQRRDGAADEGQAQGRRGEAARRRRAVLSAAASSGPPRSRGRRSGRSGR